MDSRIQKMAQVLITYSTAVKPGDRVLFRGTSPAAQPLMQALTVEALKAGGIPFNYIHISDEDVLYLKNGTEAQIAAINPMLELMYETANVIIRIEADDHTRQMAGYPAAKAQARQRSRGGLINIQMRREGAKELRRCTTLFPTRAYAQDADMTVPDYEDFVFGACMVHLDDPVQYWRDLAKKQDAAVAYLAGKKQIKLTGKNIDMTLSIAGRTFVGADGRFNFPDGEFFTGPVENSVNGWVRFTFPLVYQGNMVRGAELHFKDGLITEAKAETNQEFLTAMLDTDPGARRLGEFAFGTNPFIDRFTGHILFDEKIGGTVHMAVGQSYVETGGVNQSAVHWDMICDTRTDTEGWVDGEKFFENGKLLIS